MLCLRASCTISSMRVSWRPLAMAMRSMGRRASSASFTAWMPVSLSMSDTVYSQQFAVDRGGVRSAGACSRFSDLGLFSSSVGLHHRGNLYREEKRQQGCRTPNDWMLLTAHLRQRGTKLEDACAGRFYGNRKRQSRCFVEQQNDAVERTVARTAGERQAHGIKHLAARQFQLRFQRREDFLESLGGQRRSIQEQQRQVPQHIARSVTRQHLMCFHARKDLLRIVMKNEGEQFNEGGAVGGMSAKKSRRAPAPGVNFRRQICFQPAALAQNHGHIRRGPRIHRDRWRIRLYVGRLRCDVHCWFPLSHAILLLACLAHGGCDEGSHARSSPAGPSPRFGGTR